MSDRKGQQVPYYATFLFGGLAGMGATCFVQPFHLVKNRMQICTEKKKNTLSYTQDILRKEGVLGVYDGLSAGLMRQATYTSTRLGVYTWLINESVLYSKSEPDFLLKTGIGIISGMCAACVGTPTEVALARMTVEGALPDSEKRKYKNGVHALVEISNKEGICKLWKGILPTMSRSMIINAVQLSTYTQTKQLLMHTDYFSKKDVLTQFLSSTLSGIATTIASLPIDIAKTRLHNMKYVNGIPEYKGVIDVLKKIVKTKKYGALWRGFTPYFFKLGPHTVLTFIFLEQIEALYKTYCLI